MNCRERRNKSFDVPLQMHFVFIATVRSGVGNQDEISLLNDSIPIDRNHVRIVTTGTFSAIGNGACKRYKSTTSPCHMNE